jgi:hypothetical protein
VYERLVQQSSESQRCLKCYSDTLQVVRISSLTAALAKLNIKIPVEDVIKAVHDEDAAERRVALFKRNSILESLHPLTTNLSVALQPTKESAGLQYHHSVQVYTQACKAH